MFKYYIIDSQSGRCPLHWASSGGCQDIVEYLLRLKVDVDPRDEVNMLYFWPFAVLLKVSNPLPTLCRFDVPVEKLSLHQFHYCLFFSFFQYNCLF